MKNKLLILSIAILTISCNKEEMPQLPVAEKTYSVGDYYNVNEVKGVVYKVSDGGEHGMIVSLDNAWLSWSNMKVYNTMTFANDYLNGLANMELIRIKYSLANYPAFKWCDDKNTNGISGWYLPAITELNDIWRVYKSLNNALARNGGIIFEVFDETEQYDTRNYYLSSTENKSNSIFVIEFIGGFYPNLDKKYLYNNVRAVRKF